MVEFGKMNYMRKILPKNFTGFLLFVLILVLVVQNPLPVARLLYKLAPVAEAEEIVRYFLEEAIVEAVDENNKSVVEIIVYNERKTENLTVSQEKGKATGIIVSSDGLILTNKHILSRGNKFAVLVNDKDEYEAEMVVKSPVNDLALLKIEAKNLRAASLGESKNLKLGQTVLAIGYAKGEFSKTVTRGVVSGLDRDFAASDNATMEHLTDLIQTDAMINNGSSGGPLINIKGEVIGITTAMDTLGRGINFALPIHKAKLMILTYKKTGKFEPGWLGVYYILNDDEVKKLYGLPHNYGAYLTTDESGTYYGVLENSPAQKAGLKMDDLLLEVNGVKITEDNPLADLVQEHLAHQVITLKIYRNEITFRKNVVLGKWPEELDPLNP